MSGNETRFQNEWPKRKFVLGKISAIIKFLDYIPKGSNISVIETVQYWFTETKILNILWEKLNTQQQTVRKNWI